MSKLVSFEGKSVFDCITKSNEYLTENKFTVHVTSTDFIVVDGVVNLVLNIEEKDIVM